MSEYNVYFDDSILFLDFCVIYDEIVKKLEERQ